MCLQLVFTRNQVEKEISSICQEILPPKWQFGEPIADCEGNKVKGQNWKK